MSNISCSKVLPVQYISCSNFVQKCWASSPHPDRRREWSINSKQITLYDPVLAEKQKARLNTSAEEAKGQATAMPEMVMPETVKPDKTIAPEEQQMPVEGRHL
jgi:hypothetical protein